MTAAIVSIFGKPRNRPPRAIKASRARSVHHHPSFSLCEPPRAVERPRTIVFPTSDHLGRRCFPVDSDTAEAFPILISPAVDSWSSHESVSLVNSTGDGPWAKRLTGLRRSSSAELIAGDSAHLGDHDGYPHVRLDPLSTPMCSDPRAAPPFPVRTAGAAPLFYRRRRRGGPRSNLTSGPGGDHTQ